MLTRAVNKSEREKKRRVRGKESEREREIVIKFEFGRNIKTNVTCLKIDRFSFILPFFNVKFHADSKKVSNNCVA